MMKLAKSLRSAAHWCRDGYYSTPAESAVSYAKKEIYEEIASSIDNAFNVDSTLTSAEMKR